MLLIKLGILRIQRFVIKITSKQQRQRRVLFAQTWLIVVKPPMILPRKHKLYMYRLSVLLKEHIIMCF